MSQDSFNFVSLSKITKITAMVPTKGRTIRKRIGGGGGRAKCKKIYSRKGKLNEEKIHPRQLILKDIHAMAYKKFIQGI